MREAIGMTALEITRLVKCGGPLTKRIHLAPDGTVANDSGIMRRMALSDWRDFAALIEETPNNVAYALGAIRADLAASVRRVAKADPQSGQPGLQRAQRARFSIANSQAWSCLTSIQSACLKF
jgi:hypothetical protein